MRKPIKKYYLCVVLSVFLTACSIPVAPVQSANPNLLQFCLVEGVGKCIDSVAQIYGWPIVTIVLVVFNFISFLVVAFLTGFAKALSERGENLGKEILDRMSGKQPGFSLRDVVKSIFDQVKKNLTKPRTMTMWQGVVVVFFVVVANLILLTLLEPNFTVSTRTPSVTATFIAVATSTVAPQPTTTEKPTVTPKRTSTETPSITPSPNPTETSTQPPTATPTFTSSATIPPTDTDTPLPTSTPIIIINPQSKPKDSQNVGEPPRGLVFSPDKTKIIVAGREASLQMLNVGDLDDLTKFAFGLGSLWNIVQVPNSNELIAGSANTSIYIWRNDLTIKPEVLANHGGRIYSLTITETEQGLILVSGGNNEIKFWSLPDGQLLRTINYHTSIVTGLSFSPDGKWLVSSGNDKQTLLWRVFDGKLIQVLGNEGKGSSQINEVAFVPNKTAMVIGASEDGIVYIWEENNGDFISRPEKRLAGFDKFPLTSLIFSPDGELVVTGDSQGNLRIWNFEQRNLIAQISAHTGPILSLAFSPDGRFLATGGETDFVVKLWQIRE